MVCHKLFWLFTLYSFQWGVHNDYKSCPTSHTVKRSLDLYVYDSAKREVKWYELFHINFRHNSPLYEVLTLIDNYANLIPLSDDERSQWDSGLSAALHTSVFWVLNTTDTCIRRIHFPWQTSLGHVSQCRKWTTQRNPVTSIIMFTSIRVIMVGIGESVKRARSVSRDGVCPNLKCIQVICVQPGSLNRIIRKLYVTLIFLSISVQNCCFIAQFGISLKLAYNHLKQPHFIRRPSMWVMWHTQFPERQK